MPDGRLYIYGSHDTYEKDLWCCYDYLLFSSDDPKAELAHETVTPSKVTYFLSMNYPASSRYGLIFQEDLSN